MTFAQLCGVLILIISINAGAQRVTSDLKKIKFTGIPIALVSAGSYPPAPKTLLDFKDKVVVIDFWASWCEPCKFALPHYNELYKTYRGKNVIFVGINEDDEAKDRDATLKQIPLDFPIYQDKDQEFAKIFQVVALPSLYVLNRKHEVVALFRGFEKSKTAELEKVLQDLIKTK